MVNHPEDIRYVLEQALYKAQSGRPGPVWLDIPLDVQGAIIDTDTLPDYMPPRQFPISQEGHFTKLKFLLKESKRPVILAGHGIRISRAIDSLLSFAETWNIPIVTTYLGVDIIDSNHPNFIGRVGIKGTRAGNLAVQNADILIVIGSSLPIAETGYEHELFAPKAKKIVIDIDGTAHKKNTITIDLFFELDAKEFLNRLLILCEEEGISPAPHWLDQCNVWKEKYPVCMPDYHLIKQNVNIYSFIEVLCQHLTADDIIVTDAGSAFFAGSQAVNIKQGMRYITSGGLATMGFSIPASIGASIARNKQRILCLVGDGSFQQNVQELQTIVHYKLPIKIFVLNNEGYLSIRYTQTKLFNGRLLGEGPTSGTSFPDTEKIAFTYNIPFYRISHLSKLTPVLKKALGSDKPVICEVMLPYDMEIVPTLASEKRADGSMISKPLDDMYPFLSKEEKNENMVDLK
jgi:acetolactate synthase-1/2/3 large subunit